MFRQIKHCATFALRLHLGLLLYKYMHQCENSQLYNHNYIYEALFLIHLITFISQLIDWLAVRVCCPL